MIVTHKIKMDLSKGGAEPCIKAVQDDKYSRNIEFSLFSDGEPWEIPEGITGIVHYMKSDGISGRYDALPDGTTACTIEGNTLTVALAPQVCVAAGIVRLAVSLVKGQSELNTFPVQILVWSNPDIREASEPYVNLPGVLPYGGWLPNMYLGTDAHGNVVARSAPADSGSTNEPGVTAHGIVWDLVNVTSSNAVTSVNDGASLTAVLTPASGYTLGDVTVTMSGEALTGVWNADSATVTIATVTGDVIISCAGVAQSTGEPIDTSPVIAQSGYCYRTASTTSPNVALTANANYCVTKVYEFSPDVDAIEAHPSYDASLGYINSVGGMAFIKHFVPNTNFLENGGTDTNGTYKKAAYFIDGELEPTLLGNLTSQSTEGAMEIASKNAFQKTVNGVAFTLYQADIDGAYAYWSKNEYTNAVLPLGVNDGDIIFAGKNTQYYGMTNINGNTGGSGGTGTASIAEEVDNAVMMLSLTTGETAVASDYSNLDANYVAMVQANYDAMMAECLGDYNKIPLIVSTDQHGDLTNAKGGDILKLIGTITNWYEIGKCINLGDTCGNYFTESTLQTYLSNTAKYIPLSKRVDVYGNHDIWDADETQKYTVNQKRVSPYFKNIYARRRGINGYFTVVDDYYNVKYLVINNMEYPDTNMQTHRITTAQAKFIVSELSANDGYDIIILSHIPIDSADVTLRDGTTGGFTTTFLSDATANTSFHDMLAARKDKTSGTFTDSEGVEHSYDFSNMSGDILMSMHGHDHHEAYKTMENGVTEFLFDCMKETDTLFYFGYIDRENKKFKYWRNEVDAEAKEISIA